MHLSTLTHASTQSAKIVHCMWEKIISNRQEKTRGYKKIVMLMARMEWGRGNILVYGEDVEKIYDTYII